MYKYGFPRFVSTHTWCLNIHTSLLSTSSDKCPLLDIKFIEITCLFDLKFTLENLLCYPNKWRVVKFYYHSPSIDNKGGLLLSKSELKTNEDLTIMLNTFNKFFNLCGCKGYEIDKIYSKDVEMSSPITWWWNIMLYLC